MSDYVIDFVLWGNPRVVGRSSVLDGAKTLGENHAKKRFGEEAKVEWETKEGDRHVGFIKGKDSATMYMIEPHDY